MKIKRTKQGASSRHPEGKLEIVPNKNKSRETSPVSNGSDTAAASELGDPALMSAADIVAAAKAAAVKHGGLKVQQGNKVRLAGNSTAAAASGSSSVSEANKEPQPKQKQSNGQSSLQSEYRDKVSKVNSNKSSSKGAPVDAGAGPPAAKRPKVSERNISTFRQKSCIGRSLCEKNQRVTLY